MPVTNHEQESPVFWPLGTANHLYRIRTNVLFSCASPHVTLIEKRGLRRPAPFHLTWTPRAKNCEELQMGTTIVASTVPNTKGPGQPSQGAQNDSDRRRRRRAQISAQVHVKALDSETPFEEVCMSVDVSRDGLLFAS